MNRSGRLLRTSWDPRPPHGVVLAPKDNILSEPEVLLRNDIEAGGHGMGEKAATRQLAGNDHSPVSSKARIPQRPTCLPLKVAPFDLLKVKV
ncbi:hypothetical protein NDU88_005829 [Pleurodeles waltl]|uniref:Uncharacterized protein n=1 Tax=Pleurodeles waltl TaxID=8319 RepID=A0AAV7TC68_PLEWA|nr:hypothetical protein NDU88_005829 [Pleurodeles waltl]